MAINDSTSYELTGAQVKDLANKIKGKAADNTFVGATSSAPGSKGLVPQPQAGDDTKFLSGDGSWQTVADNYSTTEQAIGTWIDGRTVYRKVLAGTTDSSLSEMIPHGITNFGNVINVYGYIHASNGRQPIQRVVTDGIVSYGIGVGDIGSTNIMLQHPANEYKSRPYAIVMEYIKTS